MNSNSVSFWNILYWLGGTAFLPVALLSVICKIFNHYKSHNTIHGKVVLITGASSGLGEALAHILYRKGCKLILCSRNIAELERVKSELQKSSSKEVEIYLPEILRLDLCDLPSIPQVVKKALEFHGHVDILVNNAGISYRGWIESTSVEVDQKVMMINYFGQVCLTKAILPSMLEQKKGHILTISSVQGKISIPERSAYTASKHALQAFCDSLRAEVANRGVAVTVISPGYIKTKLSVNAITGSGDKYGVLDESTAKGYTPAEVAERIVCAILREEKEVIIAPLGPKVAIIIRNLIPSLYFFIMRRRALKSYK